MNDLHSQRPAPEHSSGAGLARSLSLALAMLGASALPALARPAAARDAGPIPVPEIQSAASLDGLTEILSILSSNASDTHARSLALAHLVAKGPRSTPAIFAILSGSAPIPEEILEKGPLLTPERQALLFDAMRSWDSRRVAEHLRELLEKDSSLSRRIVAVRVLGQVGNARSVEALFEIVDGFEPEDLAHPSVRGPAVQAASFTFARDPLSYVVLSSILRDFSPEQVDFVVDAISQAGRVESVAILEDLLGRRPELDERVLAAFATLGVRELVHVAPKVRGLVHGYLTSTHPGTRQQAARTLGILKDAASFLELTELLDDATPGVAESALEALRCISGTAWPADGNRWRRWYQRERRWLEEQATALSQSLDTGSAEAAVKAIRELASHPLFATEMARTIGRAVDHQNRAVAILACEALGRLRTPDAVDLLLEGLYDPREAVREAAATSLRMSTGEELPTDGSAWRRWLQG